MASFGVKPRRRAPETFTRTLRPSGCPKDILSSECDCDSSRPATSFMS